MTTHTYSELQYHCPLIAADDAAKTAIAILNEVEKIDPAFLVYLLTHSNVLVLSGLRAIGPYSVIAPSMTPERMQQLETLLAKHGLAISPEWNSYEEPNGSYSLINTKALAAIPHTYAAVKDIWKTPKGYSPTELTEWCSYIEHCLAMLMERERLPKKWLADWWAPHNIRFGMMLGYPGEAISSSLWTEAEHIATGNEPPIEVYSLPEDAYYGALVGFYASSAVIKLPEPAKLMRLWEEVARIVEQAYDIKTLRKNKAFAAEFESLTAFDHDY